MKKILFLLILSTVGLFATAQTCSNPIAMCPDTVKQAHDTLIGLVPVGTTSLTWTLLFGHGHVNNANSANASVDSLVQGETSVWMLTVNGTWGPIPLETLTTKYWPPAPCPVCPVCPPKPTIKDIDFVNRIITYSDGSTSTF